MSKTSSVLMSIVLAAGAASCTAPETAGSDCPDPTSLAEGQAGTMAHVRYLADDALEGRDVASAGERCAATYIVDRLDAAGLEPAGLDGTWMQPFEVRTGSRLGDDNALVVAGEETTLGGDWAPFGFSGTGRVEAPLIHVAGDLPADSTEAAAALEGRIVVLDGVDADAPAGSLPADPHFRASVARNRGAAAVVVLYPDGADLPALDGERRPFLPIPVVAARGARADAIRAAAEAGQPATVAAAVEPAVGEARNVVALLPGSDPERAAEVVVVGAHYDHLGHGGDGSLAPDSREIHNGADDNASGTAALLEVAARLADGPAPARPILFIAFSGEERGLLGSAHYVRNPTVPLDDAVAMLNMDMVGRLRDNTLTVFGMVTAPEWESLVRGVNEARDAPFQLALLPDGYGPSDHSSFYGAGIPVLHFFTNTHTEYHRPVDDWDTLNGEGLDRIADLVADIAGTVAGSGTTRVATLTPVESQPPAPAAEGEESARGYGPYFGSIPDMAPTDYGVRLSGVREGSPAERAGLQAGDVLVRFGDTEVTDLYAFTYGLRDAAPGDRVEVVVERDGQRLTMYAVLGERR
ncbi:MAG: M28 family peptidase [Longimicrobiales bacterium]